MPTLPQVLEEALPAINSDNSPAEKWETCSKDFPWYPLSWLYKAQDGNPENIRKAALWVPDETRLHLLLNAGSMLDEKFELPIQTPAQPTSQLQTTDNEEVAEDLITEEPISPELHEVSNNSPILDEEPAQFEPIEETAIIPETISEPVIPEHEIPVEPIADLAEIAEPENGPRVNLEEPALETEVEEVESEVKTVVEIAEELTDHQEVETTIAPGTLGEEPLLNITLRETTQSPKPEPLLSFEPMHLVDYFASQGIKLDPTTLPVTKLDQQVKSFTQWLKTMKPINYEGAGVKTDSVVDAQATASLLTGETNTEAMAEVLEKQGKFLKAIGVFEKLILLHPEKSTFFAARIKELREKL